MAFPLINGVAHSWANVFVKLLGVVIQGVSKISYEDMRQKENNYGAGGLPVSRGTGNYEAKASITLYAEEVEKLQFIAPNRDITLILPFEIEVGYIDATNILAQHTIKNCEFMSNKREVGQGDKKIETQFDIICSHIEW